jgi:hypothetical protein
MADIDDIYASLEHEQYEFGDEPAYHITRGGETFADVLWNVEDAPDPDAPVLGGYWHFAGADGSVEDWRDIPKDDHGQAISRAKERVAESIAQDEE